MTPRSPSQHQQPKTTTISRRLRNRVDQNLSVQPPEITKARGVRPRRAATSPTPHHNSVGYQTPEPHPPSLVWNTPESLLNIQHSNTSHPTNAEGDQPSHLLVAQNLDFPQYDPAQGLHRRLASGTEQYAPSNFQVESTPVLPFLPSPLPSVTGSHDFELQLPANSEQPHEQFLELQDMSTLGFMMAPSQYGMNHYGSPPTSYSPGYPPQQSYAEQISSTSGPYSSSYASSPAIPIESQPRRQDEQTLLPPYQPQPPSLPRSLYQQQQPLSAMRGVPAPLTSATHSYTYPAHQHNMPSQSLGSNASGYPPPQIYPPTTYGVNDYSPLPTMYPPSSTTPAAYPSYESSQGIPAPLSGAVTALSSSPGTQGNAVMPRILNSRPKPQCWEHGCNGRQFSTFSNLLRHQREKSGTASKSYCPRCGAEFTRTTARNGHMAHDKCKPRRDSESSR